MISKENVYIIDLGTGTDTNLLPLASGLLSSFCKTSPEIRDNYEINILFLREDPVRMVGELSNPAVVAFSCYVWNFGASLTLAELVKRQFPQSLIVFGGPQVPKQEHRIKFTFDTYPFVDVLVASEGEYTFADLLGARLEGRHFSAVQGISFRSANEPRGFTSTPRRARVDLNAIPSPFLDGTFDRLIKEYGPYVSGAVWETNRGCPYACTFCDWGGADVSTISRYDMSRLHEELLWMSKNQIAYVFAADANFGILSERDLEVAGWIAESHERTGYPEAFVVNWAKNSHTRIVAIAETLRKAGVSCNVTLSMQSHNPETLRAIKRRNLKEEQVPKLKKEFHDRGVPTYTEVILGLPEETYSSFVAGFNKMMTPGLYDCFIMYLALMLENTEMATPEYRGKYRLETRFTSVGFSRRKFQEAVAGGQEVVVGTGTMGIEDWQRAYAFGYFCVALYNHRIAFFLMNYLRKEFDVAHTDFVEFLLEEAQKNTTNYPRLALACDHIKMQRESVLNNGSEVSAVEGVPDVVFSPSEAVLTICSMDYDQFYADLKRIVVRFCQSRGFSVSEKLLDEVLLYQKIRVATWPVPTQRIYRFETNVPYYFKLLTAGEEPPAITFDPCVVELLPPQVKARDFAEYSKTRVRRMTVMLCDVLINGISRSEEPKPVITPSVEPL